MRNCGFQSSKQLMSKSAPKIRICCSISWFWVVGVGTWQLWADDQKMPIVASIVYRVQCQITPLTDEYDYIPEYYI
jgi:hypothetical protein